MKHLALFLCLLWLVPVCGLCETILWEDEAGQVILGDDGNVQFISPDGEAADENLLRAHGGSRRNARPHRNARPNRSARRSRAD